VKWSRPLLLSAIVFYIFYDILSTLAAYKFLGSFQYEKSFLIRSAFDAAGIPGFIALKVAISSIAIFTAYALMECYSRLRTFGAGILAGASAAGLFVGTSNFNILISGSSFWVLGLDSGAIAAAIIVLFAAGGLLLSVGYKPAPTIRHS